LFPAPPQAAGLEIPADSTWTIFAPTNKAFENEAIQKQTGLSAKQLLEPSNKAALTQVGDFCQLATYACCCCW
jgi:hypothetical protein